MKRNKIIACVIIRKKKTGSGETVVPNLSLISFADFVIFPSHHITLKKNPVVVHEDEWQ